MKNKWQNIWNLQNYFVPLHCDSKEEASLPALPNRESAEMPTSHSLPDARRHRSKGHATMFLETISVTPKLMGVSYRHVICYLLNRD